MDTNPLVSVIVPIYMIDRYIGICVESIINQTYRNLEIILVDDGSKDRCPEICDLYASKDQRIKVIHKPNGGLVSARKAGLQESNGAYISYVDGDDWIGSGFIESLLTSALSCKADIVCAGRSRDLFAKSEHFGNLMAAGVYEGERLNRLRSGMLSYGKYYNFGVSTYVWDKLFRKDVLTGPQMAVDNRISIGEDAAVTYPVLANCTRAAIIDNVSYHYRQREDSMLKQRSFYADDAKKLKVLYDYLIRWAEGTNPEYGLRNQVLDYVLSLAIMRSGGRLPDDQYSTFDKSYYGKKVVIYSAGTFGQQLMNRFNDTCHCNVVGWLDDDYWEYRRCCMDVDPVESITGLDYDYVLVATVIETVFEQIATRLLDLGVPENRILKVTVPDDKEGLVNRFLDVEAVRRMDAERRAVAISHA